MSELKIISILAIFIGIFFPIVVVLETDFDGGDKVVDCFDKYDNKIQGISCVDEYSSSEVYGGIMFVYIFSIILICLGVWGITGGDF